MSNPVLQMDQFDITNIIELIYILAVMFGQELYWLNPSWKNDAPFAAST